MVERTLADVVLWIILIGGILFGMYMASRTGDKIAELTRDA